MKHYVEAQWPVPQPQINWVDQFETVEQWLNETLGLQGVAWAWVPAGRRDRICIAVANPSYATLVKLRFS